MPIAGVIIQETKEVLNFVQAVERKLMKWGFARSLQEKFQLKFDRKRISVPYFTKSSKLFLNFKKEAQAANGFIVDPTDGQTYTVADAVEKKLVKANHANILTRAEKGATKGYEIKDADGNLKTVSFFEGLKNRENS